MAAGYQGGVPDRAALIDGSATASAIRLAGSGPVLCAESHSELRARQRRGEENDMHRIHATALTLATLLISAAPAAAHDWGTLVESPPTAAELGAVLAVTEELQAATLAEGEAPALDAEALAADWLGWLIGATQLDRRDELDAFSDRLVAAGVVEPDERGLAIAAWRHGLEHLALAWDARALGATRARAEQAEERLTDPNLPPDEAVRLSYLASLGTVAADPEPPTPALLERLGALLAAARAGGEKR